MAQPARNVSREIAAKVRAGWALSAVPCPICNTLLVREKPSNKHYCCQCQVWAVTEAEAATMRQGPAPASLVAAKQQSDNASAAYKPFSYSANAGSLSNINSTNAVITASANTSSSGVSAASKRPVAAVAADWSDDDDSNSNNNTVNVNTAINSNIPAQQTEDTEVDPTSRAARAAATARAYAQLKSQVQNSYTEAYTEPEANDNKSDAANNAELAETEAEAEAKAIAAAVEAELSRFRARLIATAAAGTNDDCSSYSGTENGIAGGDYDAGDDGDIGDEFAALDAAEDARIEAEIAAARAAGELSDEDVPSNGSSKGTYTGSKGVATKRNEEEEESGDFNNNINNGDDNDGGYGKYDGNAYGNDYDGDGDFDDDDANWEKYFDDTSSPAYALRMQRSDAVSALTAQLMLQQWSMSQYSCPNGLFACTGPLMQARQDGLRAPAPAAATPALLTYARANLTERLAREVASGTMTEAQARCVDVSKLTVPPETVRGWVAKAGQLWCPHCGCVYELDRSTGGSSGEELAIVAGAIDISASNTRYSDSDSDSETDELNNNHGNGQDNNDDKSTRDSSNTGVSAASSFTGTGTGTHGAGALPPLQQKTEAELDAEAAAACAPVAYLNTPKSSSLIGQCLALGWSMPEQPCLQCDTPLVCPPPSDDYNNDDIESDGSKQVKAECVACGATYPVDPLTREVVLTSASTETKPSKASSDSTTASVSAASAPAAADATQGAYDFGGDDDGDEEWSDEKTRAFLASPELAVRSAESRVRSERLAAALAQGLRMTSISCCDCYTPLVEDPETGKQKCVGCGARFMSEAEYEALQSQSQSHEINVNVNGDSNGDVSNINNNGDGGKSDIYDANNPADDFAKKIAAKLAAQRTQDANAAAASNAGTSSAPLALAELADDNNNTKTNSTKANTPSYSSRAAPAAAPAAAAAAVPGVSGHSIATPARSRPHPAAAAAAGTTTPRGYTANLPAARAFGGASAYSVNSANNSATSSVAASLQRMATVAARAVSVHTASLEAALTAYADAAAAGLPVMTPAAVADSVLALPAMLECLVSAQRHASRAITTNTTYNNNASANNAGAAVGASAFGSSGAVSNSVWGSPSRANAFGAARLPATPSRSQVTVSSSGSAVNTSTALGQSTSGGMAVSSRAVAAAVARIDDAVRVTAAARAALQAWADAAASAMAAAVARVGAGAGAGAVDAMQLGSAVSAALGAACAAGAELESLRKGL